MTDDAIPVGAIHRRADDVAGAVRDLAIGYEQQFLPVGRPRRIDLVIERAVVVPLNRAAPIAHQWTRGLETSIADVADVQQKVAGALRRDERQPITLRRPSRSEEHTSELQSLRHLVCRL